MNTMQLLNELSLLIENDQKHVASEKIEQIKSDLYSLVEYRNHAIETLNQAQSLILKLKADYWTVMSQLTQVQLELISSQMKEEKLSEKS